MLITVNTAHYLRIPRALRSLPSCGHGAQCWRAAARRVVRRSGWKWAAQAKSRKMKLILRALPLLLLSYLMEAKLKDFYTFKVVNSRGRLVSLEKYRGSVSLALFWTKLHLNGPVHARKLFFFIIVIIISLLCITFLFSPSMHRCTIFTLALL